MNVLSSGVFFQGYPLPTETGHYWAKLVSPTDMPVGEHWNSTNWEVVQVNDNGGSGSGQLTASVPGVEPSQWLENFIWGPRIPDFLEPSNQVN